MLTICVWRWGSKYAGHYVERLKAGVARHLKQEYRFAVFGPQAEDEYLTNVPGCFCRLRSFDPVWQQANGLEDRIVWMDLDAIVTGPLDELFDRPEELVLLEGGNAVNPCKWNGSLLMLRAGARPDIWSDFSLDQAARSCRVHSFPDDQGWLEYKAPSSASWKVGPDSGVYCFQKPMWPKQSDDLPEGAKIVAFPGWRDPSKFGRLEWIRLNWGIN